MIGKFTLNKPLDKETYDFLVKLAATRRMKRKNLDSKYGIDGEFYVDGEDNGAMQDDATIVNYNAPPSTQPGLWLQWEPSRDRKYIKWDRNEKFYNYIEWLEYLLRKVLIPRGYYLTGVVKFRGEDKSDRGTIEVNIENETDIFGAMIQDEPLVKQYYDNQI
jgi:hypothetical protein